MLSKINGAEIILNTQYVKDFSFENPNAPEVYTFMSAQQHVDVSVNINAQKLQENLYELSLLIDVNAKSEDSKTIFIIELVYAGVFTIKNVDENADIKQNLFIDCPSLIFPFARTIIANMTITSGFPPVLINMMDFEELYNSKKETL